jgi:adenylate kinase
MSKIVYLTGAPATGKSTLTENLQKRLPQTSIFTYSKELASFLNEKNQGVESTQDDLRRESAKLITREDVAEVDNRLLKKAQEYRGNRNFVIDSHPVTIEEYGFRITPFAKTKLSALAPDIIICLYAEPKVIANRIKVNAAGRPLPSEWEITMHIQLQCNVASVYAFDIGASFYLLDANKTPDELLESFIRVTKLYE